MTEIIRKPDDHQNLRVDPEVWRMVNSEKRAKDTMNDVLKRIFAELDEFRMNVIKQAEKDIIEERLDAIDEIVKGGK